MGRECDVVHGGNRVIGSQRFGVEHVVAGAANAAASQPSMNCSYSRPTMMRITPGFMRATSRRRQTRGCLGPRCSEIRSARISLS